MSIKLMTEAWGTSGLIASQKLVLIALCDHANEEGFCFPSHRKIADKCDLSTRSIKRIEAELVEKELLAKVPQFRKDGYQMQNLYQVLPKLSNEGVLMCEQGGAHVRAGGVLTGEHPCNHHITINKPIMSENLFGEEESNLKPILQNRFEEFWSKWVDRTQPKAPAKKAWEKIVGKKHSYDVQEYILNALENQKKSKKHLGKQDFLPHASTWLNQERWLDEVQEELPYGHSHVR